MRHAPPIAEDGRLGSFLRALPTVSRFVRVTQNAAPSVRDRTDAEAHSGVFKDTSADILAPDALASPAHFWGVACESIGSFRDPRRLQREVGPWSNVSCAREAPIICTVVARCGALTRNPAVWPRCTGLCRDAAGP